MHGDTEQGWPGGSAVPPSVRFTRRAGCEVLRLTERSCSQCIDTLAWQHTIRCCSGSRQTTAHTPPARVRCAQSP